jgi:hypothetical protein
MIPLSVARLLAAACYAYLAVGLLLLPWWHWAGLRRIDAVAAGAAWPVRLILSPGLVLLWPALLRAAWRNDGHPRPESNAHRCAVGKEAAR